jgi:hypothetical protein
MDFLDSIEEGASDFWNSFDLNKFIATAADAYKTIRQANQSPTNVVRPGTVRTLPDGSRALVNADGSLTVTSTAGQVQTIGTTGRITAGLAGQWLPGIPNVVAIGGGVVLAFLALRAFKG